MVGVNCIYIDNGKYNIILTKLTNIVALNINI